MKLLYRVLVCCFSFCLLVFGCYLYTPCVLCVPFPSDFNIFACLPIQKRNKVFCFSIIYLFILLSISYVL